MWGSSCEATNVSVWMSLRLPVGSSWSSPLQWFSLLQWYVTWWRLLWAGRKELHPSKRYQLPTLWELSKAIGSDRYSPVLISFCFNPLPSLAFLQNTVERHYTYQFLRAHINDTSPSSGDSVLQSLIKCHGLWAYGLTSLQEAVIVSKVPVVHCREKFFLKVKMPFSAPW